MNALTTSLKVFTIDDIMNEDNKRLIEVAFPLKQVSLGDMSELPEADLSWHVRAWGRWVLDRARRELARFYPTYASFEVPAGDAGPVCDGELKLVPLKDDGRPDIDALNAEYDRAYLKDQSNPRWIAKPTVAYLWARTVRCKGCRATLPLLKTQWLCDKKGKRVRLTMQSNEEKNGVAFGVEDWAGREEPDRDGTMSRSGASCPLCGAIMKMSDLRAEGMAGRIGQTMTAVVVNGRKDKQYRAPTEHERRMAEEAAGHVEEVVEDILFGVPDEPLPGKKALGMRIPKYGFKTWGDLFLPRQLIAIGTFIKKVRELAQNRLDGNNGDWLEPVIGFLALSIDRLADYSSAICMWHNSKEQMAHTFSRFALPMVWDICEVNPFSELTGDYRSALDWVSRTAEHLSIAAENVPPPTASCQSVCQLEKKDIDVILTDPPYYDAIPYSDCMDFFHVWLKRTLWGLSKQLDDVFESESGPKWDEETDDGELIEDESRFGGVREKARYAYENGMYRAFQKSRSALNEKGRMTVVFANKQPNAWESLVAALIKAGFVGDGSWPIETEMMVRMRAHGSAALGSSVWLVCRKRPKTARPGWDNKVLAEMYENITDKLRGYWDAGIRGPNLVWAATGPALEAYSKHPAVKKADRPGELMDVGEFLQHVRRFVVDFQVGRVLSGDGEAESVGDLDDPTTYYLLHRHDFGMEPAPAGAVILYALSCGMSDSDLAGKHDLVSKSGENYTLKPWQKRKGKKLGYESRSGAPVPMVDMVHRLMHLWRAGDVREVDEYITERGLMHNELFSRVLQSILELSTNQERSILESISNHLVSGAVRKSPKKKQTGFDW